LRNVAEIASWYEASDTEKRAILARLDQRRLCCSGLSEGGQNDLS
jgi:predicted Fe-S protein YdhL (DUF1289 family)